MLTNFQIHIFRPLEVLYESKTVGLLVAPDTLETGPVPKRTESILPVPLLAESKTLEHVTTGESNECLHPWSAMLAIHTCPRITHTGFNSSKASAISTRRPFLRPL
jgi:hypothetical protein